MNICVFCSSSNRVADEFKQLGNEIGRKIAKLGHTLVYGGATGGLMDSIAEGATEQKGKIIGVIPEIIIKSNRANNLSTEVIITADMQERKKRMKEIADVFLVLPGGYGTLDEMFDVIASGSVGEHKKPLFVLNYNGFFNKLIDFSVQLKRDAFTPYEEMYKPEFINTVDEVLQKLAVR
ncbi:MAG: TIGR00730 family Rossman fold protein [Porphyromonadaceae bacterium]|nr:TIGR00730 family Rossman fold protein [Porphyromonadaceae bacterium]